MDHFVKVIVPLKIAFEPFYKIRRKAIPGDRLLVKLSGKEYTAVVLEADAQPDIPAEKILPAVFPENPLPRITREELDFWKFISKYYMCTLGEVYAAAYPQHKTNGEKALAKSEKQKEIRLKKESEHKSAVIARLKERLAKKEEALSGKHSETVTRRLEQERDKILSEIREREHPQPDDRDTSGEEKNILPTRDKRARELIQSFQPNRPVLVHGGPERDVIIAECIKETLSRGLNAFVVVPEINVSKLLLKQLRYKCGKRVTVFNSDKSMGERREAGTILRTDGETRVYVGTQSALFLPFRRLGLVVIDAEENSSHKAESSPRTNARDAAIVLAGIHGCGAILSTACPSLESFYNVMNGKYTEFKVEDNGKGFEVIDTSAEILKSGMAGSLSLALLNRMRRVVAKGGKCLVLHPWMDESAVKDLYTYAADIASGNSVKVGNISGYKHEDISGYDLVAVLSADRIGRKNDYRADEKTVQMLYRIRSAFDGEMVVQTSAAGACFLDISKDNIMRMLNERYLAAFPPYVRDIHIRFTDHSDKRAAYLSSCLHKELESEGFNVMPVQKKYIGKDEYEQGFRYIRLFFLKNVPMDKKKLQEITDKFQKKYKYFGHVTFDVDPI